MKGSVLLRQVRLVDLDGSTGSGELVDVAIRAGVIEAIGPELRATGVEVVDGGGRWAIPGL